MRVAGYNRRHCMRTSRRFFVCFVAWLALVPACRAAEDWGVPAGDLARQIAALTGPEVVSLSVRNNSSIAAEEVPAIRRHLLDELGKLGVTVKTGGDAATSVRVTLSQSATRGLWVAEVQQGPEVRVAMVSVANAAPVVAQQGALMQLRKTLLFSQTEPVLDAELIALPGDAATAPHLVVLSAERIVVYRGDEKSEGAWIKERSFEVTHGRPYPRDVRGRLQMDAVGLFKAYLPGVICGASQQTTPGAAIAVSCVDSDDPWPIGSRKAFYNSSRNYFTGVMAPSQVAQPEPFYSAAELVEKRGAVMVYGDISGQFRVYEAGAFKTLAGSRDWGSDVAGVQSGCGSGAQLLATASGDAMQDSLLAYEIEGRDAIAASAPMPLDGQVTTMWPMVAGVPAAMVIVERQQPGSYEVYSVSVVCN